MEGSCGMAMMQGNSYELAVRVAANCGAEVVKAADVRRVQFVFVAGGLTVEKFYEADGSGEVEWSDEISMFLVPLSESETMGFESVVKWQVRVVFLDGSVKGTRPKSEYLYDSITERVLSAGGSVDNDAEEMGEGEVE